MNLHNLHKIGEGLFKGAPCLLCGSPYEPHDSACPEYVPGQPGKGMIPPDAKIVWVPRSMGYRCTYLGPTSRNYWRPPRGLGWVCLLETATSRLRAAIKPFEAIEVPRETHVVLECYVLMVNNQVVAQRYYKYVPEINVLFLSEKEDLSYRL